MTSPLVVVAGLGPVGAALALLLGRAGVRTLAIEREADVFPFSRAVALDDEALRVLQAAGVDWRAAGGLLTEQPVRVRSRTGAPLLDLPPRASAHGHPALAFFHQPDLERALRDELARQPSVEAWLGCELEGFRQHAGGVTVTARDRRTGGARRVEAAWLLACDGGRSAVRRQLGVRLRGLTFAQRWLVVDTRSGSPGPPDGPFEFICDPARPTVAAPLPGGRKRWEFMLLPGEEARAMERPQTVRALLARCTDPRSLAILRATVYTFHARVAERWRTGRVLLLGDAAHLSPPFAGQGLSAGLRDAHNAAWKVAAVTRGDAHPKLLDSYEAERRPHAARLIALAVLLGLVIQTRSPRIALARDVLLAALLRVPAVRGWAERGGWKPPSRYRRGRLARAGGRGGEPLPQPTVRLAAGEELPLDDVLGEGFALVGAGDALAEALDRAPRSVLDALSVRLVEVAPSADRGPGHDEAVRVEDPSGLLHGWLGPAGRLALVRPDRHVYATFAASETASALRRLERAIGVVAS